MLNRNPALSGIRALGAAELARRIADGCVSSVEVVQAFIARCEQLHPTLNAIVSPRYEEALQEAELADQLRASEELLPPLHGVPITVKDCFDVAGLPTTAGLRQRGMHRATSDAEVVRRLRAAGAIVLGKTNVPQAMLFHECDNPLFGLTPHPENATRSCGGSSGGEAAIIAAGGSPLGFGTDLGGSIRVPAHFCGIHGFKPTSERVPCKGVLHIFPGMHEIRLVAGPMGKRVEDLAVGYQIISTPSDAARRGMRPFSLADVVQTSLPGLRVGMWVDDGYCRSAPSIVRAVREAAARLTERGVEIVEFQPPHMDQLFQIYCGILAADGGAGLRRWLAGERVDPRLQQLLRVTRIPRWLREPIARWLERRERRYEADMVRCVRRLSADAYWQLCVAAEEYRAAFKRAWHEARLDAALSPPLALPAFRQGDSAGLVPAATSAFLPNLLDLPAGVVATTRVHEDEQGSRSPSADPVDRLAVKTERDSAGLPVGVQVMAMRHEDTRVLALMAALEPAQLPLPL